MAHHRELCISGAESSSAGVGAIGHKYREECIYMRRRTGEGVWEEIAVIQVLAEKRLGG